MRAHDSLPAFEQATGSCSIGKEITQWALYLSLSDSTAVAARALKNYSGPDLGLTVEDNPGREGIMFRAELMTNAGSRILVGVSDRGIPNAFLIKDAYELVPFEDRTFSDPADELITDLTGRIIYGPCPGHLILGTSR